MLKKTVLLVVCMLLTFSSMAFAAGDVLVKNGSFEKGAVFPDTWEKKMWDNNSASDFTWENGAAHSGNRYVTIVNHKENHARLWQEIKVKSDTYYKLSCWIKAEGCLPDKKGAGIGVENVLNVPDGPRDTGGKWEYFEFYGQTSKNQNSLELNVTVGSYGSTTTGKASFDDVAVEEISSDELPQSVQIYKLYVENNGQVNRGDPTKKIPGDIFNKLPAGEWTFLAFVVLVIYLLFAVFYLYYYKPRKAAGKKGKGPQKGTGKSVIDKKYMNYLYIILGLGLLLRLIIAPFYKGYHFDYGMFRYWATTAADNLFSMYHPGHAYIDYPPVYVIVLAFCGMIFKLFHIAEGTPLFITILKLPAIAGDVLTAYIIFILAKKRLDIQKALILTALYLFNPLIWFDTVIWGQVDSVFFLTMIAIFICILQKRYEWATVFMAISVLTKPQGIIFGPVLMFELIRLLVRDRDYKTVLRSLGAGALTAIVIILPFTVGNSNPLWLYDLLFKMTGTWQFASINAFNFFALVGGNWKEDYRTFIVFTYKTWGDIFLVVTVLFTGLIYWKSRNKYTLFFAALILDVFTFTLSSRMHERYLYPATVIVLFIYIFLKERKALDIFIATSATNFLNIFLSFISIAASGDIDSYAALCRIPPYNPIMILSSFINVCVLVYTIKFVVDVIWKRKALPETYEAERAVANTEQVQM